MILYEEDQSAPPPAAQDEAPADQQQPEEIATPENSTDVVPNQPNVLSDLEASIDRSIDDKVVSYLTLPEIASMPLVAFPSGMDSDENAVDDVLVRLRKKVATLEKRREDILESLRKQRNDAALRTARGMVSIEDDQLRRAM